MQDTINRILFIRQQYRIIELSDNYFFLRKIEMYMHSLFCPIFYTVNPEIFAAQNICGWGEEGIIILSIA